MALNVQLSTAERFLDAPAIYFPHSMDWRGRLYPVPAILNPQGSDVAKGLLHFAEGKPLTERGARWLKIHTANLFGVDKVSLDARVAWVAAPREEILDSADNPLDGGRFWTRQTSPTRRWLRASSLRGTGERAPASCLTYRLPWTVPATASKTSVQCSRTRGRRCGQPRAE
jgi:DNA-directed RNA polymerase